MIGAIIGLIALLQPAVNAGADTESGPRFERLENGLRIGVVEQHGLPLVSVQVWCDVGSAADPVGSEGLCQVTRIILENRDDAGQRLNAAGGRFQSRTLRDACYFHTVLPKDRVQSALEIEAARMQPLATTAEDVAAAVSAAQREYAAGADGAGGPTVQQLAGQLFEGHPYGRPAGLVAESSGELTAQRVNEFARRWFVPGNALVLVVGDVDAEAMLKRLRELFEPLEWKQPPQAREVPLPEPVASAPATTQDSSPSNVIIMAWLTPPARDLENAAIDVLMHRLCNRVDGPLAQRLAEMGCGSTRWRHERWRRAGMLVLEVRGPAEARAAVKEEVERAAKSVPNEIELNRARALARRDRSWDQADFAARALRLGWWEMIGGDLLLDEFERTAIRRLSVGDMQAAAMGLLHARQVVFYRSAADEDKQWMSGSAGATTAQWEAAMQAPKTPRTADGIEVTELRQGLRVLLKRVPGQEQAVIATRITATGLQEPAMSTLMAVGSEMHTVDEIRDYLTYHASEIYPLATCNVSEGAGAKARRWTEHGLIAFGPSEYAPQLVELQAELLRRPQTSEQACVRAAELRQKHEELLQAATQAGEVGAYVPTGFISVAQTARDYPGTADEVRDALAGLQNIEQVEIAAIGDISREALLSAIEGAWPAKNEH